MAEQYSVFNKGKYYVTRLTSESDYYINELGFTKVEKYGVVTVPSTNMSNLRTGTAIKVPYFVDASVVKIENFPVATSEDMAKASEYLQDESQVDYVIIGVSDAIPDELLPKEEAEPVVEEKTKVTRTRKATTPEEPKAEE